MMSDELKAISTLFGLIFIFFQTSSADIVYEVGKVESLYNQGQYQKALENIENIFKTEKNISDSNLISLYTYQAFSYVALDKKEEALQIFRYLLILKPNLELNPKFISPKIIEVFEQSKRLKGDTLRLKSSIFIPIEELTPTIPVNQNFRSEVIKSLLYPGLGQLSRNKKTKGYLFLGSETVSIIGLIASHLLTNSAHEKYVDNRDIGQMDRLYNDYSFWYRTRTGFIISSVSIWILNYIDITVFE